MGFKSGKIIKHEGFEPLELTEGNVQAIFNRCGKSSADGTTEWNEEALKKNRANIRYLLGQLALVYEGVTQHELEGTFSKRYDGNQWTSSRNILIDLLNMGGRSGFCSFYNLDGKQLVQLKLSELTPTCSPKDSKFVTWWEGPGGLMVKATVANDEDKPEEALSLYEKAAQQGFAKAQFQCGRMYHTGLGTAVDKAKALYWYEKAAQQGDEIAKSRLGELQTETKALQGDAEAQYAYAERLEWSNKAEAFIFYLKAAQQGHRDAQYKAGKCLAFGKGTEKESNEALKWLQAAAKQGHKKADTLSGLMCRKGLLRTKVVDLEEAISMMIDRYKTLSDSEKQLLIEFYGEFSDDLKDKFNHAQAESLRN